MENSIWITNEERNQIEKNIQSLEQQYIICLEGSSTTAEFKKDMKEALYVPKYYHEYSKNYHYFNSMCEDIRYLKKAYGILLKIPRKYFSQSFDECCSKKYFLHISSIYCNYRDIIRGFCDLKDVNVVIDKTYALVDILNNSFFGEKIEQAGEVDVTSSNCDWVSNYSSFNQIFWDAVQNQWPYHEYFFLVSIFLSCKRLREKYDAMVFSINEEQDKILYENPADVLEHNASLVSLYDKDSLEVAKKILIQRVFENQDLGKQNSIFQSLYKINQELILENKIRRKF